MSSRSYFLIMVFAFGCNAKNEPEAQEASDERIEPASDGPTAEPAYDGPNSDPGNAEPTAEPYNGEPVEPYNGEPNGGEGYSTNYWSGDFTMTSTQLTGIERFEYASNEQQPNMLGCYLIWDLSGVPSSQPFCDDCEYNFDISAIPQSDGSDIINLTDCGVEWGEELNFKYAYTTNLFYYGQSFGEALLVSGRQIEGEVLQFEPWVVPSYVDESFPAFEDSIIFNEATGSFTYSRGFLNYVFDNR